MRGVNASLVSSLRASRAALPSSAALRVHRDRHTVHSTRSELALDRPRLSSKDTQTGKTCGDLTTGQKPPFVHFVFYISPPSRHQSAARRGGVSWSQGRAHGTSGVQTLDHNTSRRRLRLGCAWAAEQWLIQTCPDHGSQVLGLIVI